MPQFFGEFLIEAGEIDPDQLQRALDLCDRVNLPVGELAKREGWLNDDQVQEVLAKQHSVDQRFGEIAIELGYLTEEQLQAALHQRSTSHLYIGEALVELGHLSRSSLEFQLDRYKSEAAAFLQQDRVPEAVVRNAIAERCVEVLPRIALRMGRLQVLTRWAPGWNDDPRLEFRRSIEVESNTNVRIGLAVSRELAEQIASAMLFKDPGLLTVDELGDALGEFLNLVVGSANALIPHPEAPIRISPPQTPAFPDDGCALLLLTTRGPGCLVVQPPDQPTT